MKTLLITVGSIVVLAIITVLWAVGVSNTEKRLANKIPAQEEVCQAFYTKMWEVLKSEAGVADEYAERFKEIQFGIMEGRYSTGGDMMKWIQEANPEFDASLYAKIMNSIEGLREGFFIEQVKLRDMKLTHDNLLDVWPSKLIVGNRDRIDVMILKNDAAKEAYETGTDKSPGLF